MKLPLFYVALQTLCWTSKAAVISVRETESFDNLFGDYDTYELAQYTFVPEEFCDKATITLYYSSCEVFALEFDGIKQKKPKHSGNDSISHFYDIKAHSAENVAHFKNKTQLTVLVKDSGEVVANGQSVANVSCPMLVNSHENFDRISVRFEKNNVCPFRIFVDPFFPIRGIFYVKRIENFGHNETEKNVELASRSNWKFYLLSLGAILWGITVGLVIFTIFYFVLPVQKKHKAPKSKIESKSEENSNRESKELAKTSKNEPEMNTLTRRRGDLTTFASTANYPSTSK
ncbi:unnamed protein product [Bursaphelenchus xylophilus]|uniref:(pine wood nematode) hypothetical protein n=1 Tax=Bursaphelenchus xylophilus TaxID=6326 RepID=A0A1I7S1A4_BURXY|nr:unnamed protein product [Bursaphelenchus xylophilus]CAG9080188.1 unnamed protein product [Bursaphelenchus xylophilus]